MNPVLTRLEEQRAEQLSFVDQLLSRVDQEGRDLVEAERSNLAACRQRVAEIDAQLEPLREFETLRGTAAAGHPVARPAPAGDPRPLAQGDITYRSAGAYIVDLLRARGVPWAGVAGRADASAAARIERAAVQNQITTDTPGLLPEPIVGAVVNTLDASRPLVTSLGVKSMAGVPGTQFSRPRITQHVLVGKQAAEKTVLPSQPMRITPVPFVKETYGGTVDVSRQDIDWTSPPAWDALVTDLAQIYGAQTELAAAVAFAAAITQTTAVASDDLAGWAAALYDAAQLAYRGGAAVGAIPAGAMPNHIWCSLDMWAHMGAIVDVARLLNTNGDGRMGSSELTSFAGDMLNAPRTVVWGFPAQTVIVGNSTMYEFYEEQIGLLSAIEPSLLGIEVAYGGYIAHAALNALAFAKLTPPAAP
jgi:hypothetical protein